MYRSHEYLYTTIPPLSKAPYSPSLPKQCLRRLIFLLCYQLSIVYVVAILLARSLSKTPYAEIHISSLAAYTKKNKPPIVIEPVTAYVRTSVLPYTSR